MSKNRVPLKGEPDFSTFSDERLRYYIDLVQSLMFSYQYCDEEKTCVLFEIWKQLSHEHSVRLLDAPVKPVESKETTISTMHKIKTVKCVKRTKC